MMPCFAQGEMYFRISVEIWETVQPDTPQFTITIFNHDNYDFVITKVIISNITVWTGRFVAVANARSDLKNDNINEVFELNIINNLCEVFIENAKSQPEYRHNIVISNKSTSSYEEGHTKVLGGIDLSHPVSSSLPTWLSTGKFAEYLVTRTNSTGKFISLDRYEIIYLDVPNNNMKIYRMSNGRTVEESVDIHNPSTIFYQNPSQIDVIKSGPITFSYDFSFMGTEDVTMLAGTYKAYKIKTVGPTLPDGNSAEGIIWLEEDSGLVLKQHVKYPDFPGIPYLSNLMFDRELKDSNILLISDVGNIIGTAINAAEKADTLNQIQEEIVNTYSIDYDLISTSPISVPLPSITPLIQTVGTIMVSSGTIMLVPIVIKLPWGTHIQLISETGVSYNLTQVLFGADPSSELFIGVFEDLPEGEYSLQIMLEKEPPENANIEYTCLEFRALESEVAEVEESKGRGIPGFPYESTLFGIILGIMLLWWLSRRS